MLGDVIAIAITAGKLLLDVRRQGYEKRVKRDAFDIQTDADVRSEELIARLLHERFPNDSILSEEKGFIVNTTRERIWMADPLDGTKAYDNGGDGFSVMIGLLQHGKPRLGVVYAPARELLMYAEEGKGAYMRQNGEERRITVRPTARIADAIMITRVMDQEKRESDKFFDLFAPKETVQESSVGLKAGLIAMGKADFHINTNLRASKWDTCAPQVILEEAGGSITDMYGNALDYTQEGSTWATPFVLSNTVLHPAIVARIRVEYGPKLIAFDFGGVLYNYNHEELMHDIGTFLGQPTAAVTEAWNAPIILFEKGAIAEDTFWTMVLEGLGVKGDTAQLHTIVLDHFRPIPGTLEIMKQLHERYPLALVSTQTTWLDELEARYHFKCFFDIIMISNDIALRKQDGKEIFDVFVKTASLPASSIIFIDDSYHYKEYAEGVGLHFIHYQNPEQLVDELKKHGAFL